MNVLLSPIGGQAMPGIIEYFKQRHARVIGIDSNPEAVGRHFVDRFYVIPRTRDVGYADAVLQVIRDEQVDLFISWLDQEILFWNEYGELPAEMAKVHTFNLRPGLRIVYDKYICPRWFLNDGFTTPKTRRLELEETNGLGFPCILKPRFSSGSRGVLRIDDKESWNFYVQRVENKGEYVVQEFLPGPEYTVDFFADKGKLVNIVVRERLEHRGVSLRGEVIWSPTIMETIDRLVSCFALDGLNNVQFIASAGRCYLTDFNPRPSGTIMLSVRAGVDFFQNLIERKEGKALTAYGCPRRLKMTRYLKEHYHD